MIERRYKTKATNVNWKGSGLEWKRWRRRRSSLEVEAGVGRKLCFGTTEFKSSYDERGR